MNLQAQLLVYLGGFIIIKKYNSIKTRPAVAQLFHADGQTDMKKTAVAFHNFAISP